MDYAGPVNGRMLLILVDAHSKWIDVHPVGAATTAATIEKLRTSFATFGVPDMLVSDNASIFTSQEMAEFTRNNGIRHVTIAPCHSASNGLAERSVQTVKAGLKKQPSGSLETRLSRFLLAYRVTPHATTGVTPSELLQGRKLRTQLDLVRPDVNRRVHCRQQE
jgi:transposase InsO family protein